MRCPLVALVVGQPGLLVAFARACQVVVLISSPLSSVMRGGFCPRLHITPLRLAAAEHSLFWTQAPSSPAPSRVTQSSPPSTLSNAPSICASYAARSTRPTAGPG